jgi:hypothetical protein
VRCLRRSAYRRKRLRQDLLVLPRACGSIGGLAQLALQLLHLGIGSATVCLQPVCLHAVRTLHGGHLCLSTSALRHGLSQLPHQVLYHLLMRLGTQSVRISLSAMRLAPTALFATAILRVKGCPKTCRWRFCMR